MPTSSEKCKASTDTLVMDFVLTTTWVNYTCAARSESLRIGGIDFSDTRIFDAPYLSEFIVEENIWGILCNAHFLNDLIVIDFKI